MFDGTYRAQSDATLRTEVAYWLIMVLRAEHCMYGTCVIDSNQLMRSQDRVGIVPHNAFITQLHQALYHTVKQD